MVKTINHLNAGSIFVRCKMCGYNIDRAIAAARVQPLSHEVGKPAPHRPTVARLLRAMWRKHEAETAREAAQKEKIAAYDSAVAKAYPEKWEEALSKKGAERRESKRLLRRAHLPSEGSPK